MLSTILKKILMSLLTEAFIKRFTISVLEVLVKRTDNTLDDDLVNAVKEAIEPKSDSATIIE